MRGLCLSMLAALLLLGACNRFGNAGSAPALRDSATGPGVPNSVQQVYHPGSADALATPVPACGGTVTTACYDGPLLTLQASKIGYTANEPTLGIASNGTAYFAGSAMVVDTSFAWAGAETDIHRSTDGGLTWQSVQPKVADTTVPPVNADPMIYLDPDTDRIFVFDLAAACQVLLFSDDEGENWTINPLACGNIPVDHQTIVAAKPRGPIQTSGYPNMLIWCSNRIIDGTCGRSFDGGLTWSPGGQPFLGVSTTESLCSSLAGHLAADREGMLYLPTGHCGFPEVAVSADGGLTWTVHTVSRTPTPVTHTSVAADDAGNVYYVWIDDEQRPFIAWSLDHGQTWSEPLMVAPPGVAKANFPVVAAGAPGKVAINFPSQLTGLDEEIWDQTVVVTDNLFDEQPVFLSATANDPAQPVHRGPCRGRCGGMWDFLDIEISKAGEAWASASFDCTGRCLSEGAVINDHSGQGVAIRQIGGPALR
jgi:hypothetical protein